MHYFFSNDNNQNNQINLGVAIIHFSIIQTLMSIILQSHQNKPRFIYQKRLIVFLQFTVCTLISQNSDFKIS